MTEPTLGQWQTDETTGERTLYTRLQAIPFCQTHQFDRNHGCTKCPYVFTGFQAQKHLQKVDGIYDRQSGEKIA